MKFRKLRIAWSVACGIACLLLIVLWVRSYWWEDTLRVPYSVARVEYFFITSGHGLIYSVLYLYGSSEPGFGIETRAVEGEALFVDDSTPLRDWHWFRVVHWQKFTVLYMPHWFPVLVAATLASVPWIHKLRFSFSLRALLIATTVVAVALGLAVYAARG